MRRTALETHKRMMVMATFVVLDAAVGRIGWLPGYKGLTGDTSYAVVNVYQLLLLVPVLAYDAVKFGRIHHAYVIGISLFVLSILGLFAVWNSASWHRTVAAVFRFDN